MAVYFQDNHINSEAQFRTPINSLYKRNGLGLNPLNLWVS